MHSSLLLLVSGLLMLGIASTAFAQSDAAAMRGDAMEQVQIALKHRRSAYVWFRVADRFKRDKSRVSNILANQLEQQFQPEEVEEADREVERLIKVIEKNRPSIDDLKKNALLGDNEAQGELAWRYCLGDGVDQDPREAYKWAVIADAFGYAAVPAEPFTDTVQSLNNTPEDVMAKARAEAGSLIEEIKKKVSGSYGHGDKRSGERNY